VVKLGPILEAALLKAPMLALRAGDVKKAVERYRSMLQAEETESTKVRHDCSAKPCCLIFRNISSTESS
jgi:hypothetical protein